ncbi:hypothetical protein H8693_09065 [Christensenellaceae bacterium NSJ-63]|uniref:Uncharacterized protein n=1 Tax=Guopingia tenuis TaxID=2763656 RepID=A0A926DJP1_9FIRM|nr:hypothetical protein [Guopingia tenuis]MBC8539081.1 hypothetical protein [Guopingia tenuis]
MNREEASREAKPMLEKWRDQKDQIEKEARKNGLWKDMGLDSNNKLFKDADFDAKEKLKNIQFLLL